MDAMERRVLEQVERNWERQLEFLQGMVRRPSTLGNEVDLAYTRNPGLDTRRSPAMLRSRFGPNFSSTTSDFPTCASSAWNPEM